MRRDDEKDNLLYQALDHDPWATEYWENLFRPLRRFLINKLATSYGDLLSQEDLEEAADEIIIRLYRYFNFSELRTLSEQHRRMRFHSFVKKTISSVIYIVLDQKGLMPDLSLNEGLNPSAATTVDSRTRRARTKQIAAAFALLSDDEQQILRFRIIDRLSYREIASRCQDCGSGPSVDALKMRFLRALRVFRQVFDDVSRQVGS
jgi:DNA-directed RNA polymerase specialized sigma24 family protein